MAVKLQWNDISHCQPITRHQDIIPSLTKKGKVQEKWIEFFQIFNEVWFIFVQLVTNTSFESEKCVVSIFDLFDYSLEYYSIYCLH